MKKIIGCLFTMCILLSFSASFAGRAEIVYEMDEPYQNCVFQVDWEHIEKTGTVTITSPEGNTFGNLSTPERTSELPGRILINVGNASVGKWTIAIEGDGLGKVNISGGEIPTALNIDVLNVSEEDHAYTASWQASGDRGELTCEFFLDNDDHGYDGQSIDRFVSDAQGERLLNLLGTATGQYYLYMKMTDESGIYAYAYADEVIDYQDVNAKNRLEEVRAFLLNQNILIAWAPDESELFNVMLFDPETGQIIFEDLTHDFSYIAPRPEGYDKVMAAVATYADGKRGNYEKHEVIFDELPEANVVYPENDSINTTAVVVSVDFRGPYKIDAYVNDESVLEEATEPGEYLLPLEDGDNSIVFLIQDEAGNMITFPKRLYVDTTAPQLSISEDVNGKVVESDLIYIDGYTEAGATLYCNDNEVEKIGNSFSIEQMLVPGDNPIVIKAVDIAGNVSLYSAVVQKKNDMADYIKIGILIVVGMIFIVIYGGKIIKHIRKEKDHEKSN
ncbi:hypothetical protein KHM83_16590 [Fusibacter paucivorans]|uniref:Ig-like domain (Group 3) n=1 Tax=Fusibacter paucivorans TaxID=76009 RepID=A0ABS5PT08_9FIRM|nr:hypothetical protein [Fusibacter paucivorans]MBS7528309.1 hypothetical protein [Fusibacter paucivorans]